MSYEIKHCKNQKNRLNKISNVNESLKKPSKICIICDTKFEERPYKGVNCQMKLLNSLQ